MPITMTEPGTIHPTAVIGSEAELGPDVAVGPFTIIEGDVRIGPGCVIEGHACLSGPLVLGRENHVGHGAVLGKAPQGQDERATIGGLVAGDRNVFREYVTIHRGTGGSSTAIGDRNYLMIGAHVGHDARIGDGCTVVNGAMIGGDAELHDGCILSAHAVVHARARVGRLAMIGGLGSTSRDVPPFVLQQGHNSVSGLNLVGLRRAKVPHASIAGLREAYRILFKEGRPPSSALRLLEAEWSHVPEVREWIAFIGRSRLGINPARESDRSQRA